MRVGQGRKRVVILSAVIGLLIAGGIAGGFYYTSRSGVGKVGTGEPSGGSPPAAGTPASGSSVAHASTVSPPAAGGAKEAVPEKKAPVPVSVAAIATGDVSAYITSTANLVAEDEVKVLAEAEGRVAQLEVEEGDRVSKGQILASLVRDDADIALKKAELRLTNARLARERAVKALAEDLVSRQDFDKVQMEDEIAQQELEEAKWRLEKTTIRAPFAGRVTEREIRPGQHVRPPDHLFTVADFEPLIARIYLPEKDIYSLREGREVKITLKANESSRFTGRIRQISPVVDPATGTVKVTVEAGATPPEVRPGAFVTIDIVRETHPRAVLLPREAVIRELQDAYVFVAKGDVAERRAVSLGLEEAGRVEAVSGVQAGEQVIVAGHGGLKDGSPIKVLPSSEASAVGRPKDVPVRG